MTEYQLSRASDDERVTNLLRDVAFNRHSMNDGHHVSPYDNGKIQVGTDGIVVKLTQGINEDAFKRTLSQATRATIGLDLNVPQAGDWEECAEYSDKGWTGKCQHLTHHRAEHQTWEGQVPYGADWEEMLKGGLQTALESQVIVFQVQGVSRTCTHQIVRTRNAAYHQQSQRASYYGDQPEARMPESVFLNPRARDAWIDAKLASDRAYRIACEEDISYQDARFALLEATTNYIMCEYSLREFINVYAYRGCSMFSWEIVHTMREMRRLLIEAHPWLEPYIKISCEKTGPLCDRCGGKGTVGLWHNGKDLGRTIPCPNCKGVATRKCTFQGWEEVEGQCDFPWAKEGNRTFVSTAHGIKKRPGIAEINTPPKMRKQTLQAVACPTCKGIDERLSVTGPGGRIEECSDIWHRAMAPLPKRQPLGERVVAEFGPSGVLGANWRDDIANADVLDEHPCGKAALAHRHSAHEWQDGENKTWYCEGFPKPDEDEDK